jgi:hypothetical protein
MGGECGSVIVVGWKLNYPALLAWAKENEVGTCGGDSDAEEEEGTEPDAKKTKYPLDPGDHQCFHINDCWGNYFSNEALQEEMTGFRIVIGTSYGSEPDEKRDYFLSCCSESHAFDPAFVAEWLEDKDLKARGKALAAKMGTQNAKFWLYSVTQAND